MPRHANVVTVEFPDGTLDRCWIDVDGVYSGPDKITPLQLEGAVVRVASAWALTRMQEMGFNIPYEPNNTAKRVTTVRLGQDDSMRLAEMCHTLNLSQNDVMLEALNLLHTEVSSKAGR